MCHEPNREKMQQPDGTLTNGEMPTEMCCSRHSASDPEQRDEDSARMINSLQEECLQRRPDRFVITQHCLQLGAVPRHLRAMIWAELLGVSRNESSCCMYLSQSIAQVETDLVNQKVIRADAARTRANEPKFKQNPENLAMLTRILTFYCKSRNIRYKQGMNEVLAPFVLVQQDFCVADSDKKWHFAGESGLFQFFYAMIGRFLPQVFVDREFKALQCSLQLFRLLLLYHDPILCHFLDQHDMTPEIYVTPWFMTLFARNLAIERLLRLWDLLLMDNDPLKLHFLAVSLVLRSRETILLSDVAMLPQVLSKLTFESIDQVNEVWLHAQELFENTPISFRKDLYNICYVPPGSLGSSVGGDDGPASFAMVNQFSVMACLGVYPNELVSNLMSRICIPQEDAFERTAGRSLQQQQSRVRHRHDQEHNNCILFMVIDCRSLRKYDACHLSVSYHIDPEIVSSPEALEVLFSGFARMKGCHFCFVGETVSTSKSTRNNNGTLRDVLAGLTTRTKSSLSDVEFVGSLSDVDLANNTAERDQCMDLTRVMLLFLQRGFEHVCFLKGGFDALKKEILAMNQFAQDQLLVYDEAGDGALSPSQRGAMRLLAARKAAGDWIGRIRSNSDKAAATASVDAIGSVVSPACSAPSTPGAPVMTPPSIEDGKMISALSKKLQTLGSVAKEALNSRLPQPVSRDNSSGDIEMQFVDEEEWVQVCVKTQEALERSRNQVVFKEVTFDSDPMGISFMHSRHGAYRAVVETLTPGGAADATGQIRPHDFLVAINDQSVAEVPFSSVVNMLKTSPRPIRLRFQCGGDLETFDALAFPPSPPTLMIASHHSLCLSWQRAHMKNAKYHLQYARHSDFLFAPWASVVMKKSDDSRDKLDAIGITSCTNGTLVGLEPGESIYFRVRCGDGERWSPYSPTSSLMTTLEKHDERQEAEDVNCSDSDTSTTQSQSLLVFLPGESPEYTEKGVFYYRVVLGLRARSAPVFNAKKLELSLEKGTLLKCSERLVAPGTNQVFVRLCDVPLPEAWAFENTRDGAMVLERLPDSEELYQTQRHMQNDQSAAHHQALQAATAVQQQAKSLGAFLLNASGLNSSGPSAPMPPQLTAVSATSLRATWHHDPRAEAQVTKYQLQFSKKRLAALWTSIKTELPASTQSFTLEGLTPNTWYLVRLRSGNDNGWSAFSESSVACKTRKLEPPQNTESVVAETTTRATAKQTCSNGSIIHKSTIAKFAEPDNASAKRVTLFNKAMSAAITMSRRRALSADDQCSDSNTRLQANSGADCINLDNWRQDAKLSADKPLFTNAWKVDSRIQVSNADELALLKDDANQRLLVVSHVSFHCFHIMQHQSPQLGIIEYQKPLSSLVKITSKKSIANSMLIHFKRDDPPQKTTSLQSSAKPQVTPSATTTGASATPCATPHDQLMFLIDSDVAAFADAVRRLVNTAKVVPENHQKRNMNSFPE